MTNTTTTTKMTKVQYFEAIRAIVEASDSANKEGAVAFINHELELLGKKRSASANSKAKAENKAVKDAILAALVEVATPVTVTELQKSAENLAEYSNQKLSALLRGMVEEGTVVKTIEKKRSYFSVA